MSSRTDPKVGQSGSFLLAGLGAARAAGHGCKDGLGHPGPRPTRCGLTCMGEPTIGEPTMGEPPPLLDRTEPPRCLSTRWFLRWRLTCMVKGATALVLSHPLARTRGLCGPPFCPLARCLGAAEGRVRVAPGPSSLAHPLGRRAKLGAA